MTGPVVGVSLKMYLGLAETRAWCRRAAELAAAADPDLEIFVAPEMPALGVAAELFRGTRITLAAQNMWHDDRGAFTGETGAPMLAELGVGIVELGHAERRRLFGEDDALIALKVSAALRNGLTALICIGEPDPGSVSEAAAWCANQVAGALEDAERLGLRGRAMFAYEPVWAIGADRPADTRHVRAVVESIRGLLGSHPVVESCAVLYGGTAGPGTLTELAGAVDGVFLGRRAHDPVAFAAVLDEASTINQGSATRKTMPNGSTRLESVEAVGAEQLQREGQ